MSITIKTVDEQERMRTAGRLAGSVLEMIEPYVNPGVTTDELNAICHEFIVDELKAVPAPLNYRGFPKSICTSINHVVCHGIPGPKRLKNGDIINVDVTIIKDGWHGDTSRMFLPGEPSVRAKRLCHIAHQTMWEGIRLVKPGLKLGEIGRVMQRYAEAERCSVVRNYCGHGIGRDFHEDPQVLNYYGGDDRWSNLELQPGMCFTIEPMVNLGKADTKEDKRDGWTVTTRDRSLSAQWEHTILVTETGYEVLTLRSEEVAGENPLELSA